LVAPAGEEAPAIVDGELPAVGRYKVGAAGVKDGRDPAIAGRKTGGSPK
jgi:hypothetical protein